MIEVPKLVKAHGYWWIPPLPPHWEDWMGEYESFEEAEEARLGVQRTINSPDWTMMLIEMEEEFDEEWARRLKPEYHGGILD